MNKHVLCSFVCGSVLAIASNAYAQSTDTSTLLSNFHFAPYLQGSLGSQQISSPGATGMAMNLNGTATAVGVRGAVGVQLNPYFGLEGTWFDLPSTSMQTSVGTATTKGAAYVASVTASLPLNGSVGMVGRIGAGISDVNITVPTTAYKSDSRENLTVWGVGARFNINNATELTLDYDNLGAVGKFARGDSVKVEMISVGVRFKF